MALHVVFYLSKFFIELYNLYIIYSVKHTCKIGPVT